MAYPEEVLAQDAEQGNNDGAGYRFFKYFVL